MQRKNMWKEYTEIQQKELEELSVRYKECLDIGKTERECVKLGKKMADAWGYKNLEDCISEGTTLKAGDKVYADCMGKAFVMFQLGKKPLEEGMNILGAHIDSPRIDVKQNPLYEDSDMAYLDTHYYGGIKKYQWVTIPLAIHGTIAKKDGTVQDIIIGEKEDDPVLVISDLLIHLSQQQIEKKAGVVVEGEGLDILVATKPLTGNDELEKEEKELVKAAVVQFLKEKLDMEEEDFLSAELEIVPAGKARDCGLDRSMVIGYGQDDRVCAFTSLFAMLETENPERTSCCILVDKEEIEILQRIRDKKKIILLNKSDKATEESGFEQSALKEYISEETPVISISAKYGDGIDNFIMELKNMMFHGRIDVNQEVYITNARHKDALAKTYESLECVERSIEAGMPEDFFTIDLMNAYEKLGLIIGESVEEDLVNEIFSKFCTGK